jgi:pyrroloquinoline quinone biosynthesis protein B
MFRVVSVLACGVLLLVGTSSFAGAAADAPRVVVLGTAQDGGLPHVSCTCPRCQAARRQPSRARSVASLALVRGAGAQVWLVDATPDLREQLERLRVVRGRPTGAIDRRPLDGIVLTHSHFGHVTGLGFLGFEALHTRELPVHCTEALAAHLAANAPWADLVARGNIVLVPFRPGERLRLADDLALVPFLVPHRDEHADTIGLRIEGPHRALLYVPDTDAWDRWDPALERRLEGVSVALLDGTFFSGDELPDRGARSIGHPPIRDTLARLGTRDPHVEPRILFTHLNHSNPAVDRRSPAAREIRRAGYGVAEDGDAIGL